MGIMQCSALADETGFQVPAAGWSTVTSASPSYQNDAPSKTGWHSEATDAATGSTPWQRKVGLFFCSLQCFLGGFPYLICFHLMCSSGSRHKGIPVVPHKAVAEVSKIGNYK